MNRKLNKKRMIVAVLTAAVLIGVSVSLAIGDSEPTSAQEGNQIMTVAPGDLTIEITAAGNLALSTTEDLTFDLFYQEGTVEEVLVEEGDTVEAGQVLAHLDTDEWEDELSALEDQVIDRERDLLQAQINLQTAEQSLKNAWDNEAASELALLNAEINLEQAQQNLNAGIAATDYDAIIAELNKAETWYDYIELSITEAESVEDMDDLLLELERAEERLMAAQAAYDNALAGYGGEAIAIKKMQVEAAEMALAQAQENLADMAGEVAIREQQVLLSQGRLEDAQQALEDAQEALEEVQNQSPEITAPFAGFVTRINVEGGDEVLNGTVAIQLADPGQFEADILVGEMDILQVEMGAEASVRVDALDGLSLPAAVTHIAPTATIQSGVVNYAVTVEIESLEAVTQERQEARQDTVAGELSEKFQEAVAEGLMTQEEAEEMMAQGQPGEGQGQATTVMPEDFQLREGLTVTVSITVEERDDVLLVPNAAITNQGGQSYVQVVAADGTTTQQLIQTGINDWQFTEVTGGLSEGDQVAVPQGTVTTVTTQSDQPDGIRLPGLGGSK